MSAKRVRFLFGAKSAHKPGATVRALAEGRRPGAGRVGKDAKLPRYIKDEDCLYALWRNAVRSSRLGGFGTNPGGEQGIEEEILSAVSIKNVL